MRVLFTLGVFIAGIIAGIMIVFVAPDLIRSYLPETIKGKTITVEGTVVAKQRKQDWILLTISTPQGAILATFKKKVQEIELLVEEGDNVEFVLKRYEPFIDDPPIKRVRKEKIEKPGDVLQLESPAEQMQLKPERQAPILKPEGENKPWISVPEAEKPLPPKTGDQP